MKGTLYIQRNKGTRIEKPKPLECEIDLGKDGTTIAGVGPVVKAMLRMAKVDFISANGLKISGVEDISFTPGHTLYYQEWWFVPIILCRTDEKESP